MTENKDQGPQHPGIPFRGADHAGAPYPSAQQPPSSQTHSSQFPGYRPAPQPGPAQFPSYTPHGASPEPAAQPEKKRRTWPAVVGTAAVTAIIVGGGTAAGTIAFLHDDSPSSAAGSLNGLGQNQSISVTSVDEANWETIASNVAPSVVAIQVKTQSGEGEGSGVILDSEGNILTNDHVVAGAVDDTVQVILSDGRLFSAKIVGLDASTDLAVIKLVDGPADLTPATFADSSAVIVGNAVMAVGNPLGLANTVTTGIVSAVSRPVTTVSDSNSNDLVVTNAIQIDAAINPGNSGGPLFNSSGEVIGITSSIATLSGRSQGSQAGSIGLGFAIPSNLASSVSKQLLEDGTAEHAFLGVGLTDGTATAEGVTRRGAKVENVTAGSPAAQAGIKAGDVVVAFDGQPTSGFESLTAYVRERVSGDAATVTLVRSGQVHEIDVTLAAKEDAPQESEEQQGQQDDQGEGQQGDLPGSSDPGQVPGEFFDWFFQGR